MGQKLNDDSGLRFLCFLWVLVPEVYRVVETGQERSVNGHDLALINCAIQITSYILIFISHVKLIKFYIKIIRCVNKITPCAIKVTRC